LRDAGRDRETKRCTRLGTNGRMNEMSAALGLSQLGRYRENVARRQRIAAQYDEGFADLEHVTPIRHHPDSARHLYQILVPGGRRAMVQMWLLQAQISTAIHYRPVNEEPIWNTEPLPGAREHGARTLSIPLFPTMTQAQIAHVIEAVRSVDRRL